MSRKRKADKRGRSSYSMSDFVGLERYLLRCEAWRSLKPVSRAAYVEIAYGYDGSNNGRIQMSTRILGDRLGMNKASASRAIVDLIANGFIEVARKSAFSIKNKTCSEYRLTAFRCDVSHALPAKSFMRWTPQNPKHGCTGASHGRTHATVEAKRSKKTHEQLRPCNRNAPNQPVHGCTSAPLLNTYHWGVQQQVAVAQAGAAPQGASAMPSHAPNAETFVQLADVALKSLSHLDRALPYHLKSWTPLNSSAPSKILASKAA